MRSRICSLVGRRAFGTKNFDYFLKPRPVAKDAAYDAAQPAADGAARARAVQVTATFPDGDKGTFTVEVADDVAPKTAARFLGLAERDFPHGLNKSLLSRVRPEYVVQAGAGITPPADADAATVDALYAPLESETYALKHSQPGVLGMLNAGTDKALTHVYVTLKRNEALDGRFVAFGRVISGLDVVAQLAAVPQKSGVPREDVLLETKVIDRSAIPADQDDNKVAP